MAKFSAHNPRLQISWSPHDLETYMQCPRRYFYSVIERWRPKVLSNDMLFGRCINDGTGKYEELRLSGASHQMALRYAVRLVLRLSRGGQTDERSGEVLKSLDEGDDTAKNRHAAVRCLIWWAEEKGKNDPLAPALLPNGKPAIEVSFKFPLDISSPYGEQYIISGRLDKIVTIAEGELPLERKTTKSSLGMRYWDRFSPNVQISTYALATQIVLNEPQMGVLVEAFQSAKTASSFDRKTVPRTREYMDEYAAEMAYWIKRAEQDAQAGRWPKNEATCGLYGGCPFQGICRKSPGVRDRYLEGNFQRPARQSMAYPSTNFAEGTPEAP